MNLHSCGYLLHHNAMASLILGLYLFVCLITSWARNLKATTPPTENQILQQDMTATHTIAGWSQDLSA